MTGTFEPQFAGDAAYRPFGSPDPRLTVACHDAPAEAAVVGALLANERLVDEFAEKLAAIVFHDRLLGDVFEAAVLMSASGDMISPITVARRLAGSEMLQTRGGARFLADLALAADTARARGHIDHLVDLSRRRGLQADLARAAKLANNTARPIAEALAEIDMAASIAADGEAVTFLSGGDCVDEVIASLDREVTGVRSGTIDVLDNLLGPLQPGDLIYLAARPGMGKTACALSYMRGAAKLGHPCLFASLEMSWQQLAGRLVLDHCFTEAGGIRAKDLRFKTLTSKEKREICRVRDPLAALPYKIIDSQCHTLSQLRRAIRRRKRELQINGQKLDLVIVDYIQLLMPDSRARSEYEALSEVSRELKKMAKAEGTAMIALAQLSREPEKRAEHRPVLSDLRGSGQLEQDADGVVFLYAEEYYLLKEKPHVSDAGYQQWENDLFDVANRLEFRVPKCRNGAEGNDTGFFFREYQAVRGGDFHWRGQGR